jgi:hypothetical protein
MPEQAANEDQKPKVDGKRPGRPFRRGHTKKEFETKVVGLEAHTFDIGHAKYAAKFISSRDEIILYVQEKYEQGAVIAEAMRTLMLKDITLPPYPKPKPGATTLEDGEAFLWQQEVTEKKKAIVKANDNKNRAYALVLGQCSPELTSKVKASNKFASASNDQDVVELLKIIRGLCCDFDEKQQVTWGLEQAKHRVATFYQTYTMSNTEYIQFFTALVGVVETYGGAYGREPGLVRACLAEMKRSDASIDVDDPDKVHLKAAYDTCREEYLACMLLRGACQARYGQLKNDLANDMMKGTDNYPKSMVDATRMLTEYKGAIRIHRIHNADGDGMAFVQGGGRRKGKDKEADGAGDSTPNCWHCGKPGHHKNRCPDLMIEGIDNLNVADCDDAHVMFSADGELQECDANAQEWDAQECGFAQQGSVGVRGVLHPNHLYIDTCASYASTPYRDLLDNVREADRGLVGHSNCGSTTMTHVGNVGRITDMWLNEGGIANIVPLEALAKIWRVTYDSSGGVNAGHFVIHTDQGNIPVRKNSKGMPYIDLDGVDGEMAVDFVQTIRGNMDGFSRREVEEAREARMAQAMMGHPTDREFLGLVRSNLITNCPVSTTAVTNAHAIFGPDLAGVRGRTVRRPPESVRTDYVQIPRAILERYQLVVLTADVMFVNKVPFLVSSARGLNLITAEFLPTRTAKSLAGRIVDIIQMYARGGFRVGTVLMDNEFEKLKPLLPTLSINTTAANEHVPEIERRIRLIKERGRGILNTLPFKKMPRVILVELIYHVVLWLNAFPSKSGISDTLSPRELVLRHRLDFKKHCRAPFGSYCEVHDEPAPTNNMVSRATPAIVLGPTGNLQGTYKFFNLLTGLKIKRRSFTPYPMPDSVIKKVEGYATKKANPNDGDFDFADRSGILFEWNDCIDEGHQGLVEEDVIPYPTLAAELPGVTLHRDLPVTAVEDDIPPQGRAEDAAAANAGLAPIDRRGLFNEAAAVVDAHAYEIDPEGPNDDDDDGIIAVADIPPHDLADDIPILDDDDVIDVDVGNSDADTVIDIAGSDSDAENDAHDDAADTDSDDDDDDAPNDDDVARAAGLRRSARATKGSTSRYDNYGLLMHARRTARGGPRRALLRYGFVFFSDSDLSAAAPIPVEDRDEYAFGVILQQYSVGAGLKKFKERGELGVTKELEQMHNMSVFTPVHKESLSAEERKKAVSSLMFLKEKRDESIKARFCADGRKQRGDWTKQDTTSPTVATESVFLTAVIEAHEGRDVGCFDIPGAFLHADCDENITMILKGRLAELMVQVAPNLYRKYITVDKKNTAILYVKMQKALYGLLRSALLFYRRLVGDLERNGFIINPYDPCVANKQVGASQMTVCWHVDDLKVSHADAEEVTRFGEWLNATYGISVVSHRGKIHDYLGMILDYSCEGKVIINMAEYIKSIVEDFPEEITGFRATPAADHLFDVRDPSDARPLPEEQARAFHHTVAQLLFLSARARRDIQPATAFLTTRVTAPDEDDWGKLKRLLQYLNCTLHMPLILSADSLTLARWWVDAAYAVHADCKGHTGAGMSLGQGMAMSYSWKQKINTKSSTEAELVGVDDSLGYILWARYFLQAQGYDMDPSLVYQDNTSAILLETNGKASSTKRTKHIKVKYFYIKDKIEQGEIALEHCPTDQMWTDINTKPKQGAVFREFRGQVMGIPADYTDRDFASQIHLRPPAIPTSVPTLEPNSSNGKTMLPIPKGDRPASQECVGGSAGSSETAAGVESERAPLRLVSGRAWSPGVYKTLRLLGKPLDVAWRRAFIRSSHF